MTRYLAVRLVEMAGMIAAMSLIVYMLIGLMPGDPTMKPLSALISCCPVGVPTPVNRTLWALTKMLEETRLASK